MLEDARARIRAALGWNGELVFTSGASEAITLALARAKHGGPLLVSALEHDAVLRRAGRAERLAAGPDGRVIIPDGLPEGALVAVQQVNNETGVIQPVAEIGARVRAAGGVFLCDAAQGAGKLPLPDADLIALSAHKFGGPPGIGALLVRDYALLEATGGQEQGYRGGTENMPGAVAMAVALEEGARWLEGAAHLRATLDLEIVLAGGAVVAGASGRIPTIASYHMPGVSSRTQLIRFDMAGMAVSAGAACSSGTLKTSPVLKGMGWSEVEADQVIRVSIGPETSETDISRFLDVWRGIAGGARR